MKTREQQFEMMRKWSEESSDYTDLANAVINIIEEESEGEPAEFMNDVYKHGCVSGTVNALIFYYQTEEFFKEHMEDIFRLYNELRDEYGECPISAQYDVNSNSLSWLAFEQVNKLLLEVLEEE